MAFTGRSPRGRPSIEVFGTGNAPLGSTSGAGGEDETNRMDDDGETVESLMNKLAIERRVQYGAEKMLDVIEKRQGDGESSEQEQVKERITAQLDAASEHIKLLEARLERLQGNGTPSRNRRRPQPRLNGYASSSSLGLASSLASSTALSSASRPRVQRQGSYMTPDKEREAYMSSASGGGGGGTPSRTGRPRSLSVGQDSFDLGETTKSPFMSRKRADSNYSSRSVQDDAPEEATVELVAAAEGLLRRLRGLGPGEKGVKGKQRDTDDVAGDCMGKLAAMLKKSDPLRMAISTDDLLRCVMPFLGDGSTYGLRAMSYRVLRYALHRASWCKMVDAGLEWLIVRSFTRDIKGVHEREQALRLLRAVIVLPPSFIPQTRPSSRNTHQSRNVSRQGHVRNGSTHSVVDISSEISDKRVPLTDGMVRALVSVAENPDDPMRTICMETLVEIGVLDLERLIKSDAFRTILLSYKDGPTELGAGVTGLLLHLVNQPHTRQYLLKGSDFETVLVGLTEEYGKISSRQYSRHIDKLRISTKNIGMLLGSWPGLIYLCMDECRAIRSLISSLYAPLVEVQEATLDLIFSSLRIKSSAWMNAFLDGKRLTVYNRTQEAMSQFQDEGVEDELPQPLNLVDHFIALLLAVLIEAGLFEALVAMIQSSANTLTRKATLLLGEILQMTNRILPLSYAAQLQALPRLFNGATEFTSPNERHVALTALSSIDSLNRNQNKALRQARERNGKMQDSLQRGQRQVQQVKIRLGMQIDDKQFQQMVVDSGVLLGRDHSKWNYEVIVELIEGPLLNPKRLDEAIKATKFVRRLFSFYHPYNNRFSSIKRTRPNHKWVKLGCSILSTMLANPEGIRFLTEDKLLRQMADCFNELDQYVGVPTAQPVLAKDRVENSLTYGYFEMIGTLSKHTEGMKLLEKFKFFTCFYHLSEQRSREDIMRIIIECFDYTIDAHPRIVLAKGLTSAYMETRLFATHHLGRLLQELPQLTEWALQLMITQLYDTAMEVCDVAVMYLEEVCSDPENLEKVVQLRPTLEHLGDVGHPLFMRFVSTSVGFQYLHQAQYIERELNNWLNERNLLYVIEVETFVSKTLRPFSTDTVEDYWTYEGTAPTHFFGELTKTPEGCQMLRSRGIVAEFAEIVRLHGMESSDQSVMTNVKSVLWALGNIGSTEGGLPFLEDEEIIEGIIEIAEQSPVLTMRGTCFFVIGLLSSTRMGAEILEEYGWIAARSPMGKTTGLCLPSDIGRLTKIEPWARPDFSESYPPLPPLKGTEGEIMTAIANLSNYVLAAGAMNNLKRIRNRQPRYFSSLPLFHRAARMISTNHYQAPVRRFVLDLFNIPLDMETLDEMVRLEQVSLRLTAPSRLGRDSEVRSGHEHRKRSASSPGPEPPGRVEGLSGRRNRGLTISGMEKQDGTSEPRERVHGGFGD
ncbi:Rapamycin-insensitive companion of mTOR, middle domain-containing protein [Papiliotrema laurentii]|uniref:Rapamycin-insensitive companion of mTOR, middle domain-containing protein n=1 Tax=Papiliotrema laurentii TaxID=5418 RepID=A0AAD9FQI0_PAPLA|nr:Rapamycin-insensitive companion of mTOR, middle domain-containing protein [Papiliotrema laurentii]